MTAHLKTTGFSELDQKKLCVARIVAFFLMWTLASGAEPLPVSRELWRDPAFLSSFNGSYRLEAQREPALSTEVRGVLVEVQKEMAQGRREAAREVLSRAVAKQGHPALLFNLGNVHFELGELEKAREAYQRAVEAHPAFLRAHRHLALTQSRLGQLAEAQQHLESALQLGDASPLTLGLSGYLLSQQGEWRRARMAFESALLREPKQPDWLAGLAAVAWREGEAEEALELYQKALRERPQDGKLARQLADVQEREVGLAAAAVTLEKARLFGALSPAGGLELVRRRWQMGQGEEAMALFATLGEVGEEEEESEALRELAEEVVLSGQGVDWPGLEAQVERVFAPQAALWKARFSLVSGEIGEHAAAVATLTAAVEESSEFTGGVLLSLAGEQARRGEVDRARELFGKAAKEPGYWALALRKWAELELRRGSKARAAELLKKAAGHGAMTEEMRRWMADTQLP